VVEQQADKLRNQINELQRQKQVLDEQNQKMLSVSAYSDPVVKFLQGSDDDLNESFVRFYTRIENGCSKSP
jgi:DNA-directed RNA polymerase delta subunit